jgi:predicted metal-dependent hydrolase
MASQIELGGIVLEVIRKDIRNVHLRVYPPTGAVRISAPLWMSLDTIRVFAHSKLDWIRKHRQQLRNREGDARHNYLDHHYLWGEPYLLNVIEMDAAPRVTIDHRTIVLQVRPGADDDKKKSVINGWYRQQMKALLPELIEKWEAVIGVEVAEWGIRDMKTRWGTCNIHARRVWLNLELARKPPQCLEYVLVHEMVHLLERRHNHRFKSLMDQFLPNWRHHRGELNRAP